METKHADGYWVQQLSDNQAKELLKILTAKKESKKFKRIITFNRTENLITIFYESKRVKRYLSYAEDTLKIQDYKISGGHSYITFFEYMIQLFGEEYAEDLLAYADKYIAENDDTWSKRLVTIKNAIPAIVDSYKHNQHNDI